MNWLHIFEFIKNRQRFRDVKNKCQHYQNVNKILNVLIKLNGSVVS